MKRVLLFALALLVIAAPASAQAVPNPTRVEFTCSDDHAIIDHYAIGYFTSDTATSPVLDVSIGKPTPDANNLCAANISVRPINFGSYIAKVKGVGDAASGGLAGPWSDPSNPFVRQPGKTGKPVVK